MSAYVDGHLLPSSSWLLNATTTICPHTSMRSSSLPVTPASRYICVLVLMCPGTNTCYITTIYVSAYVYALLLLLANCANCDCEHVYMCASLLSS